MADSKTHCFLIFWKDFFVRSFKNYFFFNFERRKIFIFNIFDFIQVRIRVRIIHLIHYTNFYK